MIGKETPAIFSLHSVKSLNRICAEAAFVLSLPVVDSAERLLYVL